MTRCVFAKNWATGSGGAIESGGTPLTLTGACSGATQPVWAGRFIRSSSHLRRLAVVLPRP